MEMRVWLLASVLGSSQSHRPRSSTTAAPSHSHPIEVPSAGLAGGPAFSAKAGVGSPVSEENNSYENLSISFVFAVVPGAPEGELLPIRAASHFWLSGCHSFWEAHIGGRVNIVGGTEARNAAARAGV